MKKQSVHSQEVGLIIGLIIGRYFFKTEDLHYGYWPEGMEVKIENFADAQRTHSELILSHIPEGIKTILDVGCGVGVLASQLLKKGYEVDCVSPSPFLTRMARERLHEKCGIFECKFEEVDTEKKYDLIMFSESFQYVNLEKSLEQSARLLRTGGNLLICDFFKTDAEGECLIGGGHKLKQFYEVARKYSFEPVEDIDITDRTAPNLDLANEVIKEVGRPIWEMIFYYLDNSRPLISRFLKWWKRHKIKRIEKRYLSGKRNAEMFKKYKSYRLMLYQKTGARVEN